MILIYFLSCLFLYIRTKFTNLVRSYTGGLIRKKRFELYNAKYETSNLTWTIVQFSKKALKNQDEQVIDVFKNAFQVR